MADEHLTGYTSLQRRLHAVGDVQTSGPAILRRLVLAGIRATKEEIVPFRKTGNLGRSVHAGEITATHGEIIVSAAYALFVEENTRAHEIRPVLKKSLAWAATSGGRRLTGSARKSAQRGEGGGMAFARVVHHPGTTGKHFLARGLTRAVGTSGLADVVIEAWNGGSPR